MTKNKIIFHLITLIGFVILFSLGTWQVYRLKWKNTIIKTKEESIAAPVTSIQTLLDKLKSGQDIEFHTVQVTGNWVKDALFYIVGRTHKGKAGYHVVSAVQAKDNQILFVNLGWSERKEHLDLKGPISLEGYIRYPYKNIFTPDPIPEKKEWGAILPDQLKLQLPDKNSAVKEVYIQLKDPYEIEELSALERIILTIDIPNRHLGYIITWYGLAIAWLFVMIRRGKNLRG